MKKSSLTRLFVAGLAVLLALGAGATVALAQEMKAPDPGVPEVFDLEGEYVRIAYNDEGFVTLGYRLANECVGEEWMMLEMGLTLRSGVKNETLKRTAFTLDTPTKEALPMATEAEYEGGGTEVRELDMRMAMVTRDPINYFPPQAHQACAISLFKDMSAGGAGLAHDEVELSPQRGCVGRVYFKVPGGIEHGQHWLNVKFDKSLVRVPFRILTKEEAKKGKKEWKDLKKEIEKRFGEK